MLWHVITATSTLWAPYWYVIPADNKKVMQAMAVRIHESIRSLDLSWPAVSEKARAQHAEARRMLEAEED